LPDVNVWLALLNREHPHHAAASVSWEATGAQTISFCRITMLGLLRLSTHKTVMGGKPYTAAEAWAAHQAIAALPEVSFPAGPAGVEVTPPALTLQTKKGTPDWTDAYLAALAKRSGSRMVSFDRGFVRYEG
jgi:uncharacterized protein